MMTARSLRLFALALPLALLLALGNGCYSYWHYYQARNEQILEYRHALGRLNALIAQSGEIDRLAAAYDHEPSSKRVQGTSTVRLSVAQLQQQLHTSLTASGAQLINSSEIPPRQEHPLSFVGLKLDVSGSIDAIANVLKTLEAAEPTLFIERAVISARPVTQESADRAPVLALGLDIVSVSQIEGASSTETVD